MREIARFRLRGDAAAVPAVVGARRRYRRLSCGIAAYVLAAPVLPGLARWVFVLTPTIALILLFRSVALGQGEVIRSQAPLDVLRPTLYLAAVAVTDLTVGLTPVIAVVLNTAAFVLVMLAARLCNLRMARTPAGFSASGPSRAPFAPSLAFRRPP